MISDNQSICPKCGGQLKYYDHVQRLVRTKFGNKKWVAIRRLRCCKCHAVHRELPDFIFPYKQYEADIIKGIDEYTWYAEARARAMARAAAQAAEAELDINSPSKVGYRIGGFFGMGFVNSLIDYTNKSYDAGASVAKSASILPMTAPEAEVLLDRIDAVVLEVNGMESVRNNTIKFVKGNPSSAPSRPTLTNEGNVHQYPLCYIYRKYGTAVINQADITPMVGTESTPFVTGILQTISLDELLGKWQDELDRFTDARSKEVDDWIAQEESDFTAWFNKMKADLQQEQTVLDQWIASEQADFLAWYNQMKDQLSGDVAGNLQLEIDKEEVKRILLVGFEDGTKEFSDDGTVITSTASDGRTLTKTFSDGFLTMTNVLKSAAGAEVARAVKTFDSDGKLISTVVTYS